MTPAVTPVLIPATSSPGSTRFPTYRRHIGKREDPGDEVAHSDRSCSLFPVLARVTLALILTN